MIVRTRTPLRVEREQGVSAKIFLKGRYAPTGQQIVLLPGDELRLPGGPPGDELVIDIDLRGISSCNHNEAVLHLRLEPAHNEDEAKQLRLV